MSLINQSKSNKKSKFAEGVKKLIKGIEKSTKVDVSGDMNKSDETELGNQLSDLEYKYSNLEVSYGVISGVYNKLYSKVMETYSNVSSIFSGGRLVIPNVVSSIYRCPSNQQDNYDAFTQIHIPPSVNTIGSKAVDLYNVAFVYLHNPTPCTISSDSFSNIENTIFICASSDYLFEGTNWNSILNSNNFDLIANSNTQTENVYPTYEP